MVVNEKVSPGYGCRHLAIRAATSIIVAVTRLRRLSAFLAILASVALGLPAISSAAAFAQAGSAPSPMSPMMSSMSSHCHDCPDCNPDKCAHRVDCMAPCAASLPAVTTSGLVLPVLAVAGPVLAVSLPVLTGERPPPDPLPPRS
jgi:hypothetical protein